MNELTRDGQENGLGDRIVRDPAILVGKPTIRGTRIPVDLVLAYLEQNPNFDDLFADYPRLTMEDVQACLAYARVLVEQKEHESPAPGTLPGR
jgi:uncharacterized protein (DUF433 family)